MDISKLVTGCKCLAVAAALAALGMPAAAQDKVDQVVDTGVQRTEEAAASQKRVDTIQAGTDKIVAQYKRELKVVDGLKVYNALLQKQLDAQNAELTQLQSSIEEVAIIQRQITPLMLRMLDGLDQFIELDVPFLLDERRNRVKKLRKALEAADVTAAEKFRAVLEAFEIENEYGRTIEAYKGTLEVEPGNSQQVDFLRVGRVALVYQSVGEKFNGYWDQAARKWQPLTEPEYRNQIKKGLKVARKQEAPDLIMLPVSAPEGSK